MNIDWSGGWSRVVEEFLSWIPKIAEFIIILVIGYIVAIAVKKLVIAILHGIHLNKRVRENPEWSLIKRITPRPAELIGSIVYWLIWILVLTIAIPVLNIPIFSQLVYGFYAYLPNIFASLIILIVATLISAGIVALTGRLMGETPTGKIVSTITPALVMTIAVFMILVQLKIATPIVIITYAAILGALSLGFALAFGLGGREVAGRILESAYQKGQENMDQAKRDFKTARERGEKEIGNIKSNQ